MCCFVLACRACLLVRDERSTPVRLPRLAISLPRPGLWCPLWSSGRRSTFFFTCVCVLSLPVWLTLCWLSLAAPPRPVCPHVIFLIISRKKKCSSGCESCVCLIIRIHITIFILLSNNNKVDLCPCLSTPESLLSSSSRFSCACFHAEGA